MRNKSECITHVNKVNFQERIILNQDCIKHIKAKNLFLNLHVLREQLCSMAVSCQRSEFPGWAKSLVNEHEFGNIPYFHPLVYFFLSVLLSTYAWIIIKTTTNAFRSIKANLKDRSNNLRSSSDLRADELITRSAGLPGSTFPSWRCFPQSTSFHDDPKATFKSPTKFPAASWPCSTMHVSVN